MTWEGFTQWLTDISNNPVFISVISILSALGSVLVIISKTSVGRKALKQLTALGRETNDRVSSCVAKVDNGLKKIDAELVKLNKEKEEVLKDLEIKAKTFYNMFDFYETQMIAVLKLIPNAKVQKELDKIESEWNEKKKEIANYVGITYAEMQDKFDELEKQIGALKEGISDGREKLNDSTEETKI